MTIRVPRLVVAGALAVGALAAGAAPNVIGLTGAGSGAAVAGPPCLAWSGNKEDGNCLSYSNGNGINVGAPGIGVYPGGIGISTGPLLPGRTFTEPIGG